MNDIYSEVQNGEVGIKERVGGREGNSGSRVSVCEFCWSIFDAHRRTAEHVKVTTVLTQEDEP